MGSLANFKEEVLTQLDNAVKNNSIINFRELCWDYSRDHYTNLMHSYPAKMYGPIAQSLLCLYAKESDTILDPFCGTGTVLMQASLYGMHSIGIDINPLACLIAKTKTSKVSINKLKRETESLFSRIENHRGNYLIPSFENKDFWFEKDRQETLARILHEINKTTNLKYKNFFKVCFSSIIRKSSNADPEIMPPVKTRRMIKLIESGKKANVIEEFKKAVNANLIRLEKFCNDCNRSSTVKVINGNFLNIELQNNSVDLVITSPPYIGSQKYIRSTRLENFWLNLADENTLIELDHKTIGTESILMREIAIGKLNIPIADELIRNIRNKDKKRAYMVYKYFSNMEMCIKKIYRVLKKNKYLILVIGDNTIRGYYIPTHKILSEILIKNGFKKDRILKDKIKYRGFMKKRNSTAGIIDYEWILIFRKG